MRPSVVRGGIRPGLRRLDESKIVKVDFPSSPVWSIGRTATRMRLAVCRVRMRIAIPRAWWRTSVLGLPSRQENLQNMQENNLPSYMLIIYWIFKIG